ncbi:uncharacterized protein LOC26528410 [Drosophila mojavensis]|uniref:Uncharacterized protein n=1 Tax=Drosophila mojavensis TaxID=7230 RepID=A0A0Q9XD02_DROMO|nr:uncharacterized protein LOC26528410 [Drosophila mojavensis]KRG06464.1 uncharacterized protein Dmoj_GI26769 [Drosophila mojavensis]
MPGSERKCAAGQVPKQRGCGFDNIISTAQQLPQTGQRRTAEGRSLELGGRETESTSMESFTATSRTYFNNIHQSYEFCTPTRKAMMKFLLPLMMTISGSNTFARNDKLSNSEVVRWPYANYYCMAGLAGLTGFATHHCRPRFYLS